MGVLMQQPISRRGVYKPSMSAVVNGETLEVSQVQVDRALPDPLTGGSLTAASASFTAVQGDDVTRTVATPWDPGTQWPPVPESPASVSMDTGAGPVSLMANGRVISASGGTGGREVDVEISDAYQSLDRPISWDGFAGIMPSEQEATVQRYVQLRASAITDRILRHCGWHATPPMLGYAALSVPAMGTMWPERGYVETCIAQSSGSFPVMYTEPWGVGVADVDATFRLGGGGYSIRDRGRMELTAVPGRLTGTTMSLEAQAVGSIVRLSWNDDSAFVWITDPSGSTTSVISRSRSRGSFVYATVEYVTDTSVRVILRVDGASSEVTVPCRTHVTQGIHDAARIVGGGCGGGFQIAFPSVTGELVAWKPNAVVYDRAASFNFLQVAPPVYGENCADLLNDQCEAQNATYWIDETGVLRWWDLARLEARSNVATLTDVDDIADSGFAWDHSLSSVKRGVTVNWKQPLVEGGWRTNVDLWQGSGSTLDPTGTDSPAEEWISVPDDEVWIMPDLVPARAGGTAGDISDMNYGYQSHYGGVIRRESDSAEVWAQSVGSLLVSIERVNDTSYKLITTWTGPGQVYLRTPEGAESPALWGLRRGFDLPIIRGKKKYMLGDMVTEAAQKGPATAPDHVIDAGWWIQDVRQAEFTANYAASRVTVPQPVLSSVALIPFPGLQLGDMVTVTDDSVTRLTIRGIVVEDSRDIDSDMGMSHSVAIRPVYVTRNGVTWSEWAEAAAPKTKKQWATNQGGTWTEWGQYPLLKEDVI